MEHSQDYMMQIVNKFFVGRDNELTVVEFFCTLPAFEKTILAMQELK